MVISSSDQVRVSFLLPFPNISFDLYLSVAVQFVVDWISQLSFTFSLFPPPLPLSLFYCHLSLPKKKFISSLCSLPSFFCFFHLTILRLISCSGINIVFSFIYFNSPALPFFLVFSSLSLWTLLVLQLYFVMALKWLWGTVAVKGEGVSAAGVAVPESNVT